ncbi:WXG100 family type VII secretion target [Anaerocolumna sp. AGMB13025]|uniref:WXG100 family type VII secretion target n=1 Tax=Anaerocolumna sp. AGMB13025 TaxID=3039116 RepID=UPI00241CAEE8|nr:WXG100 family type VII secretion target [Anaerocolumna sp. AGMB13025]WFR59036.1 WXG100 family type VII secretion target [Anaerocolumna sp. AGMB13025]
MAGTIRITPSELRTAATYLGQRLEAMTTEANSLKTKIDAVTAEWEGAAQSAFVTGFTTDMWPVLSKSLPEVINGIMAQLNATAKALEDTDTEIATKLNV